MKIDPDDMAFPMPPVYDAEAKRMIPGYVGMTIRCWLAGQALAGVVSRGVTDQFADVANIYQSEAMPAVARLCCRLADALIAELNRETTP